MHQLTCSQPVVLCCYVWVRIAVTVVVLQPAAVHSPHGSVCSGQQGLWVPCCRQPGCDRAWLSGMESGSCPRIGAWFCFVFCGSAGTSKKILKNLEVERRDE